MEIKLLLDKYKNLGYSQNKIKEAVLLISTDFSLNLKPEDVLIKDWEIKLSISGVKRTHFVLIKKQFEDKLTQELKKEGLFVSKIY